MKTTAKTKYLTLDLGRGGEGGWGQRLENYV